MPPASSPKQSTRVKTVNEICGCLVCFSDRLHSHHSPGCCQGRVITVLLPYQRSNSTQTCGVDMQTRMQAHAAASTSGAAHENLSCKHHATRYFFSVRGVVLPGSTISLHAHPQPLADSDLRQPKHISSAEAGRLVPRACGGCSCSRQAPLH